MADRPSNVNYSGIRLRVRVPRYDNNLHNRREAAWFIEQGYRVTDDYGRDLTITTLPNGARRVVVGEDALGTHSERVAVAADKGRIGKDSGGRPLGLPERELTDYEAGRKHSKDCGIMNCDHPVHFGGDEYGKLTFEPPADPKSRKDNLKDKKGDGPGGAGGAAAPTATQ